MNWCRHEISQQITRTTGDTPWNLFKNKEKDKLLKLPGKVFDCPSWQSVLVHRDHHIVIGGSFYSVPTIYIGQTVWVRVGNQDVQIFANDKCIKIHVRAKTKGSWSTDMQDYPDSARKFLELNKEDSQHQAKELGNNVMTFIKPLLSPFSRQQQRKILATFRLAEEYGANSLDAACKRALKFNNFRIDCIRNILKKNLLDDDIETIEKTSACTQGAFLRDPSEFVTYH